MSQTHDEAPNQEPAEGAAPDTEPSVADLLRRIDQLEEKTEGRFGLLGKDLGKIRARVKTPEAPSTGESDTANRQPSNGLDLSSVRDVYRYERLSESLPEKVRSILDSAIQSGVSYSEATKLAESLRSEAGARPAENVPPGHGARPAPQPAGLHPTKMSELIQLRNSRDAGDRERYKKLMADDTFDPSALR